MSKFKLRICAGLLSIFMIAGAVLPSHNASAAEVPLSDKCGKDYKLVKSSGTMDVYRSSSKRAKTATYCAINWVGNNWGKKLKDYRNYDTAVIVTYGTKVSQDIGKYKLYAGPIKQKVAGGKCITINGWSTKKKGGLSYYDFKVCNK